MTWFTHDATGGILFRTLLFFLVFFCIVFESDLKIGILLWTTKCWFVVNDIGCSFSMLIRRLRFVQSRLHVR